MIAVTSLRLSNPLRCINRKWFDVLCSEQGVGPSACTPAKATIREAGEQLRRSSFGCCTNELAGQRSFCAPASDVEGWRSRPLFLRGALRKALMSRSHFPRVAARTRPKPPPAIKLPPLQVGVYEFGELVRVHEIPDPRIAFCRVMNHDFGDLGMSARPLGEDEAVAAAKAVVRKVAHG